MQQLFKHALKLPTDKVKELNGRSTRECSGDSEHCLQKEGETRDARLSTKTKEERKTETETEILIGARE